MRSNPVKIVLRFFWEGVYFERKNFETRTFWEGNWCTEKPLVNKKKISCKIGRETTKCVEVLSNYTDKHARENILPSFRHHSERRNVCFAFYLMHQSFVTPVPMGLKCLDLTSCESWQCRRCAWVLIIKDDKQVKICKAIVYYILML